MKERRVGEMLFGSRDKVMALRQCSQDGILKEYPGRTRVEPGAPPRREGQG